MITLDGLIAHSGEVLELEEQSYYLETTENLTYIIGNEKRLLGGEDTNRGTMAIAHIEDANNTSVTDDDGYTFFDIVFDPVLAGHTVTVGVHTLNGTRLGTAKVIGLRGADFVGSEISVPNTGSMVKVPMTLAIDPENGGTEHFIDVDVNPMSFKVEPVDSCKLNLNESNFHTDSAGRVILAIETKGKVALDENTTTSSTGSDTCTVTWDGGISSTYLEY